MLGSSLLHRSLASTLKRAHVNSATIFAKCHHGQCYYPTKIGTQHPALSGRDLLGEQIEALHREGIRCPIYTSVVWDEEIARAHPDWRQLRKDGSYAAWEGKHADGSRLLGLWKNLNFLHPGYQDHVEAHLRRFSTGTATPWTVSSSISCTSTARPAGAIRAYDSASSTACWQTTGDLRALPGSGATRVRGEVHQFDPGDTGPGHHLLQYDQRGEHGS